MSQKIYPRRFWIVASALVLAGCWIMGLHSNAQSIGSPETESDDKVIARLESIVEKQSQAWNQGNLNEFMIPYWHDDRLTFSSGGTTERGWEPTFQRYQKKYPDQATMGMLKFSNLESQRLAPDVVLMLGEWKLERAEPVQGNFSLIWKRIDNHWCIVHDHSSLKAK